MHPLRLTMSLSKRFFQYTFIILSLVLSGCSDYDSSSSANFGRLSLSVKLNPQLKTPSGSPIDGIILTPPDDVTVTMTDESGKYSHTWESFEDFPQGEQYFAGRYDITAFYGSELQEGFAIPFYKGTSSVQIHNNSLTEAEVELGLVSCVTSVTYESVEHPSIASVEGIISSGTGNYFPYPVGEKGLLCLSPGSVKLYLSVTMNDGRNVEYIAASVPETSSATLYDFAVSVSDKNGVPVIATSIDGKVNSVALTDEFVVQPAPEITTVGWNDGMLITLPEGDMPDSEISAIVKSVAEMEHLFLSVNSASLREAGCPDYVDLMHLSEHDATILSDLGLKFARVEEGVTVDLTSLLSNLVYLTADNAVSTFSLLAEDLNGKTSSAATLKVRTTPVEIEILSVHNSVVGVNKGAIEIKSTAPGFANHVEIELEKEVGSDEWVKVGITDITAVSDSKYLVSFPIPDGSGPVNAHVLYCDEVRASVTIERVMPDFKIEVDPFANFGVVKIVTADKSMLKTITENVVIYANDEKGSVLSRYPDTGVLSIIGLHPSTTYHFRATMMANPGENDFTEPVTVRTEGTPQFSNGDFEERNDGVRYKNLPSGGRYSQTTVEIFNWQNHTTYSQLVPKGWANTNAKTFCKASTNYNTWYMQPSVFTVDDVQSGDFAVSLRSVAFDPNGEPIPDYAQTGEPYLPYSLNVPRIAYRAAGKLFLGDYSYDAKTGEETYNEGISWNSRPVSLNGFYKYQPSEDNWNDRGLVTVEVLGERDGEEIVIASAHRILPLATGYTAFSLPLEYAYYGVKASRIKVMFASSDKIGTIAEESSSIVTHSDPKTSTSLGSQLWIDNVTLAY